MQVPAPALAKSSPVTPSVNTVTLPSVPSLLKVIGTTVGELDAPMFTDPTFVLTSGTAFPTAKLCETIGAGTKTVFPIWLAWMEHVPKASSVADEAETVQIVGVADVYTTGSPELAVAVNEMVV